MIPFKRQYTWFLISRVKLEADNICTNSSDGASGIKHGICVDFGLVVVSAHSRCKFRPECVRMDDRIDPEKRKGVLFMFIKRTECIRWLVGLQYGSCFFGKHLCDVIGNRVNGRIVNWILAAGMLMPRRSASFIDQKRTGKCDDTHFLARRNATINTRKERELILKARGPDVFGFVGFCRNLGRRVGVSMPSDVIGSMSFFGDDLDGAALMRLSANASQNACTNEVVRASSVETVNSIGI